MTDQTTTDAAPASDYRLNEEEVFDLAERIHETAVDLAKLRDGFWSVNTFFVSDILWGLDRRQSAWLLSNIGDRFGLETDDEVERLEIDFPSDVVAGAGQMYALADKPAERKLHFVVFDRRKAEAA